MNKPWGSDRPEGPRRGRWSYAEKQRVKETWGLRDEIQIARDLRRSVESLRKLAESLFTGPLRRGPWSEEEIATLKKYLGASSHETVATILRRSPDDLRACVARLAVEVTEEPLSSEEKLEFKKLYGTRSDADLSVIFGRRLDVIEGTADELRLSKDKAYKRRECDGTASTRMPRWTDEELAKLVSAYPSQPNLEIARDLRRSVKSIVSKAHHLGLKKDPVRLQEMGRENVAARHDRRAEEGDASKRGGAARREED